MTNESTTDRVREEVRSKYAALAVAVATDQADGSACCGDGCGCGPEGKEVFGAALYEEGERSALPNSAVLASLGCGNPTAVADLREGETVLDLGSGGGIDVLLSARRVGATGRAYGLDMTDEMLTLARHNAA
ncbi:MAG: methyltransferase domain-containing protein, partial [Candidatus Dormibacteria bacterium]